MNEQLLEKLKPITKEEHHILEGECKIEKDLYMSTKENVIVAKKLLESGNLISVRTHTRFIHFPKHTHNYVEVIYMCCGSTHHIINGTDVLLEKGELLFLNQNATQEIYPAREDDIAVNFIILPEFFDYALKLMEAEENLLRNFVIDCLRGENRSSGFMHFKVAEVLPVQNLVENLIWTIRNKQQNKRNINQATMGLLILQLMNHMDKVESEAENPQQRLMINILEYIEEHYRDGELSELADTLHYDIYWLSKEIKKQTGKNYTELVQSKRLSQAAFLLTYTTLSVMEVGMAVGYDNLSYFHRIFQNRYKLTPRKFRVANTQIRTLF
ncbi:MAG: AraC family transcriptional regulator [Velocimicrobium sp.]